MNNNQEFAPVGNMNQDDSIINPTKNSAGRNAFGLGDYKYALNARIGSSRSDNFNDLEILKGTAEVTNYRVRSQLFTNPTFTGSMTGWLTIDVGVGDWTYFSNNVIISPASGDIIYQPISVTPGDIHTVRYNYAMNPATVTGFRFEIVYLNGTTVISSEVISRKTNATSVTGFFTAEIPVGCDGIGYRAIGTAVGVSIFALSEASFYGWGAGSRPAGTEKVIGKEEDKEHNRLYYCVYNSNDDHCIRFYDPSENSVFELLKWDGLAFEETYFVSMALIDSFMGITDRNNSPRLFDVDTISDLFLALGSEFREYHISFHKWAPTMPPIIRAYYDGATNNYQKFENKVYQFSYRYIYKGRLKSRWSPISNVGQNFLGNSGNQITAIEIYNPGILLDDPGAAVQYNYFGHDNQKFTDAVEFIEYGFRESSYDVWRILKRYEVASNANTSFRYSGSANSTPIPTNDFAQLFDTVPFLAGCIESIDNRFVFADCLDEQDVANDVEVTDVGVVEWAPPFALGGYWDAGSSDPADNALFFPGMSAGDADELGNRNRICDTSFKGRGLYKLGIQWLHKNGWRSGVYTADEWIYNIPAPTGIVDNVYALTFKLPSSFVPPEWAVGYQIMRTNCLNIDYFMYGAANFFTPLIDSLTALTDDAEVPESLRNRIRQHFEGARTVTGLEYSKYLETLSKKPFHKSLASDVRRTTTAAIANSSRIYININNWYNSSKKNSGGSENNPMNNLYYNYREGDRVRFIGSTNATPADADKVVYDVPILECTGIGLIVEKPDGVLWVPGNDAFTDPVDQMIEVYTPRTPTNSEDYLYYETGEWYPVLYPGTSQRDLAKRDWLYTNNAGITCTTYGDIRIFNTKPMSYGDCHIVSKTFYYNFKTADSSRSVNFRSASMNPDVNKLAGEFNEFGGNNFWEKNNGRPAASYTDLPVVKFKPTQVRFGGQAVEESFVNNINRFRDEDQKIYPSEYGRIRSLVNTANAQVESVGAIMLAIGERETFSIYVNRVTLEDLSGRSQVALSEKVLGSYNTLLGSHGTLNPESVSTDRGRVYFWDALDGTWIRYGRDGLTEISFYKMRNWFRELGQLLVNEYAGVAPVVISEFDPYNEELVTRIDHSVLPATFRGYADYKCAAFSEEDTGWKSIFNYDPEMFGRLNTQLIAFRGGSLFLTEVSSTRSTFFGTKYDVKIEPVFNGEVPRNVKIHQAISIIATHGWSVERFQSEYRGAKTVQQSSLDLSQFKEKEDGYYCEILNDVNTVGKTNPIINGDKMRSKAIRTLLKLDPSVVTESLLHYVVLGDIDSPKNP